MQKSLHIIAAAGLALALASCVSKRVATTDAVTSATKAAAPAATANSQVAMLTAVQRVYDTQVYAKNIAGSMTFSLQTGQKNVSVPGSLHMRKDEMIRLQLFIPLLGTEVGRVEFTPDGVLIVDRLHKEYIRASYSEVDFLANHGITFYTLQALFWNQLLMPGSQKVSESQLKEFAADLSATGATMPVKLERSPLTFEWTTNRTSALIEQAVVTYKSSQHGTSTLKWNYADFTAVGVKRFPAHQQFSVETGATGKKRQATVTLDMSEVTTDSSWSTDTKISDKYKKVSASDVLGRLASM